MQSRRRRGDETGSRAWLEAACLCGRWRTRKAHLSELVRQAHDRGPQRVTVRGQDAVVVLSAADDVRLAPAASKTTLAALFGDSSFGRLDDFAESRVRERAPARDLPEF